MPADDALQLLQPRVKCAPEDVCLAVRQRLPGLLAVLDGVRQSHSPTAFRRTIDDVCNQLLAMVKRDVRPSDATNKQATPSPRDRTLAEWLPGSWGAMFSVVRLVRVQAEPLEQAEVKALQLVARRMQALGVPLHSELAARLDAGTTRGNDR